MLITWLIKNKTTSSIRAEYSRVASLFMELIFGTSGIDIVYYSLLK